MSGYLLFAGATYYPSGGWSDSQGKFDDVPTAMAALRDAIRKLEADYLDPWDWYEIVDLTTLERVAKGAIDDLDEGAADPGAPQHE